MIIICAYSNALQQRQARLAAFQIPSRETLFSGKQRDVIATHTIFLLALGNRLS